MRFPSKRSFWQFHEFARWWTVSQSAKSHHLIPMAGQNITGPSDMKQLLVYFSSVIIATSKMAKCPVGSQWFHHISRLNGDYYSDFSLHILITTALGCYLAWCKANQSKGIYHVNCHESGCHSLQLHITHGLHLPSCTALTHSHPPLHQSHSCHHSLISLDCLTTPAPHSHTHTFKQHSHMHSPRSLVLAPADISELLPFPLIANSVFDPGLLTLVLWTCACDLDPCLVLFTSLLCLWYSCYCPLTIACLILPLSNKYYCKWIHSPLTSHYTNGLCPALPQDALLLLQTAETANRKNNLRVRVQ